MKFDDLELNEQTIHEVHITGPCVAFPVIDYEHGGFGQVVVELLEPGQRETVSLNGRLVTVIRDYLH